MRHAVIATLILAAACGGESSPTPPPPPPAPPAAELGCATATPIGIGPGESTVLDAASAACIRLPSGSTAREYVVMTYSASGDPSGVAGPVLLRARSAGTPVAAPALSPDRSAADPGAAFHDLLRRRERLTAPPGPGRPATAPAAPPTVGEQRSFQTCQGAACTSFAPVSVVARYVGRNVALYTDQALPAQGFSDDELIQFGRTFDEQLYPIDTTAFGRESDIDGNGLVNVVLTGAVNRLCPEVGGIVTGYFYGPDLVPGASGSNGGEVFFGLVPDFGGQYGCRLTRDFVQRVLPGTFVHEFQHMISYNQHVLRRGAGPESTWLNEGLSHFAEELAGRRVSAGFCVANDCLSQFAFNDVTNAYRYLFATENRYLVMPDGSTGALAERGAAWLFVRWLVDHFGNGGDGLTRALLATDRQGAQNVAAATATPFDRLVGEWHLANWLDDLPGFSPVNPRLRYVSWNWRTTFADLNPQSPSQYPRAFPLDPDSTAGSYDRTITLRAGSGRHLRVKIGAGAQPVDLRVTGPATGTLPPELVARVAVARIRD